MGEAHKMHKFKDLKYFILLNELPKSLDLNHFIIGDYARLKEYDAAKGTEYCKTLCCYLLNNGNKHIVCERLHINRNTLPQRLEKIETLLGHSVSEGDVAFDIYFSHIIDQYNHYFKE
jgi:purine catabolism regulator